MTLKQKIEWFNSLDIRKKVIFTYLSLALFYAIGLGILLQSWFESLPFYAQFFIGAAPIYLLFSVVLGGVKKWKRIIAGFILFTMSDVIVFPFLVTLTQINTAGIIGAQASSDVFLAMLLQSFGLTGFWLYIGTYVVLTTILVTIAVYLIPKKDLKDEFH